MSDVLKAWFDALPTAGFFCSLRQVRAHREMLTVRRGVPQPVTVSEDVGVMLTVLAHGGQGYAATCDISPAGLQRALERALQWAALHARHAAYDVSQYPLKHPVGEYHGPGADQALDWQRGDLFARLQQESDACRIDPRIVEWSVTLGRIDEEHRYLTNGGGDTRQRFRYLMPGVVVTAFADGESQSRSFGGQYNGYCQQGGMDMLQAAGFWGAGAQVADEALQLLLAPNCPSGRMDLLLMPEQMMLQIHESIGHPLELDRILGDERNMAGTSFVTQDMFGHYQYGSSLLNVTYDPSIREEFASYAWDDEGHASEKIWLIRDGILQRPLGSHLSQQRAGLSGVANARASGWHRAPIDRMANLNIEPGTLSLQELVAGIEQGVLMDTNVSWSIDDSRNKFQFGCEWGQLIEKGELKGVVKNPNYRGISANFWRSLAAVGDERTRKVMGTPYCGKGEPNQVIRVGHASPACVFRGIDVFGGVA